MVSFVWRVTKIVALMDTSTSVPDMTLHVYVMESPSKGAQCRMHSITWIAEKVLAAWLLNSKVQRMINTMI